MKKEEKLSPKEAQARERAEHAEQVATISSMSQQELDTSIFSERELEDIEEGITEFLRRMKQHESTTLLGDALVPPLKRFFILPVIVLLLSIGALLIAGSSYLSGNIDQGSSWLTDIFTGRTSANQTAEIAVATQEFIANIRNQSEERLVGLYVNLINTENAEVQSAQSVESAQERGGDDSASLESQQALQRELDALKEQINQQIDDTAATENLAEFEAQSQQLDTLQVDFRALSQRNEQAALQNDQYASIVTDIGTALENNNTERAAALLGELDTFLANPVVSANPLLSNLLRIGPAFANGIRRYLAALDALSDQEREGLANQRVASERNQELAQQNETLQTANDEMRAEIQNLSTNNARLDSAQDQLNAQVTQLRRQLEARPESPDTAAVIAQSQQSQQLTRQNTALAQQNDELSATVAQLELQLDELLNEVERVRNAQR